MECARNKEGRGRTEITETHIVLLLQSIERPLHAVCVVSRRSARFLGVRVGTAPTCDAARGNGYRGQDTRYIVAETVM